MPSWSGGGQGAISGAMQGASYGSFVPGIGTGIGAGIGGIIGGLKGLFGRKKPQAPPGPPGYPGGGIDEKYASVRARALSPARAAYSNAMRNVNRQRALQGGYSPGYQTAISRMQRQQGQQLSDSAINAEAAVQEMDIADRGAPSHYQRKLGSIGGTMDVIGKGAGALSHLLDGGGGDDDNMGVYTDPNILKQHLPGRPPGMR